MSDKWNTTTVDPSQAPPQLSEQVLSENLGHTSQFVGLMDTEDKVRGHLEAVAQYQTVKSNLLHSGQFDPDEIKRAYASTWVACDGCESPHGACVDVCAKAGRVVETFGFGPEMDAALAEDDAKLRALGAYDPPAVRCVTSTTAMCPDPHGACAQRCQFPYSVEQQADAQHPAPAPAAQPQGGTHHPYCTSLHPATAAQGCDCGARGFDWGGPAPAQQAQQPQQGARQGPATPQQVEAARVAWKDAIAKRDSLYKQWDAYVKQLSDEYRRLRGQ
jgi:hypothetical protein